MCLKWFLFTYTGIRRCGMILPPPYDTKWDQMTQKLDSKLQWCIDSKPRNCKDINPFKTFFLQVTNIIPGAPANGEYIYKLIRYFWTYISYHHLPDRGLRRTKKLFNHELHMVKSKLSLHELYGRHYDLVLVFRPSFEH